MKAQTFLNHAIVNWLFLLFSIPLAIGIAFLILSAEYYIGQLLPSDFPGVTWFLWIYFALKSLWFGFAAFHIPVNVIKTEEMKFLGSNRAEKGIIIRKLILFGLLTGLILGIGASGLYELLLFGMVEIFR